jgi:hypothetical protein
MKSTARHVIAALLFGGCALSGFAQDTAEKSQGPDFSRENLRRMFVATRGVEVTEKSPFDFGFVVVNKPGIRLRWLPILAPFLLSQANGSPGISPMPTVDPFVLTGMSFPSTPGQARDRFRDWRERRALRRYVEAANKADVD